MSQQKLNPHIEEFCRLSRQNALKGSRLYAKRTAEVIRVLITTGRHPDAEQLISHIRQVGRELQAANPKEPAIGAMVKRILRIIRDEHNKELMKASEAAEAHQDSINTNRDADGRFGRITSLANVMEEGFQGASIPSRPKAPFALDADEPTADTADSATMKRKARSQWKHTHGIIDILNELIDELENISASIAQQALDNIHNSDVIMTIGMSETTLHFFKEAHKKRKFLVIVAEGSPVYDGDQMVKKLVAAGIQTRLIPDTNIFALMSRTTSVVVGGRTVFTNGGIIAPAGTGTMAEAAQYYRVPVMVLVGLHKLSPTVPEDPSETQSEFTCPAAASHMKCEASGDAQLIGFCPTMEYVEPELVSLFVTDVGSHQPHMMNKLVDEYYSQLDHHLEFDDEGL